MTTTELCTSFVESSFSTCPWLQAPPGQDDWHDNLVSEAVFWYDHLAQSQYWYRDFIASWQAQEPSFPYRDFKFGRLLEAWPKGQLLEALDVGCGPVTAFGTAWRGRHVRLTRADPLAAVYAKILRHLRLDSTALTAVPVEAEKLDRVFQPESFHLVHARNALDYAHDPEQAIGQMLQVCKPGGAVVLHHCQNEADFCGYTGLRRWNFDVQDGYAVLRNKTSHLFLDAIFPEAAVECRLFDGPEAKPRVWVEVVLRKACST